MPDPRVERLQRELAAAEAAGEIITASLLRRRLSRLVDTGEDPADTGVLPTVTVNGGRDPLAQPTDAARVALPVASTDIARAARGRTQEEIATLPVEGRDRIAIEAFSGTSNRGVVPEPEPPPPRPTTLPGMMQETARRGAVRPDASAAPQPAPPGQPVAGPAPLNPSRNIQQERITAFSMFQTGFQNNDPSLIDQARRVQEAARIHATETQLGGNRVLTSAVNATTAGMLNAGVVGQREAVAEAGYYADPAVVQEYDVPEIEGRATGLDEESASYMAEGMLGELLGILPLLPSGLAVERGIGLAALKQAIKSGARGKAAVRGAVDLLKSSPTAAKALKGASEFAPAGAAYDATRAVVEDEPVLPAVGRGAAAGAILGPAAELLPGVARAAAEAGARSAAQAAEKPLKKIAELFREQQARREATPPLAKLAGEAAQYTGPERRVAEEPAEGAPQRRREDLEKAPEVLYATDRDGNPKLDKETGEPILVGRRTNKMTPDRMERIEPEKPPSGGFPREKLERQVRAVDDELDRWNTLLERTPEGAERSEVFREIRRLQDYRETILADEEPTVQTGRFSRALAERRGAVGERQQSLASADVLPEAPTPPEGTFSRALRERKGTVGSPQLAQVMGRANAIEDVGERIKYLRSVQPSDDNNYATAITAEINRLSKDRPVNPGDYFAKDEGTFSRALREKKGTVGRADDELTGWTVRGNADADGYSVYDNQGNFIKSGSRRRGRSDHELLVDALNEQRRAQGKPQIEPDDPRFWGDEEQAALDEGSAKEEAALHAQIKREPMKVGAFEVRAHPTGEGYALYDPRRRVWVRTASASSPEPLMEAARTFKQASVRAQELSADLENMPFTHKLFSRVGRQISSAPFEKGTGKQWLAHIQKDSPEFEREWTGVGEFLRSGGDTVLSRSEVQKAFRDRQIELEEYEFSGGSGRDVEYDYDADPTNDAGETRDEAFDYAWRAMRERQREYEREYQNAAAESFADTKGSAVEIVYDPPLDYWAKTIEFDDEEEAQAFASLWNDIRGHANIGRAAERWRFNPDARDALQTRADFLTYEMDESEARELFYEEPDLDDFNNYPELEGGRGDTTYEDYAVGGDKEDYSEHTINLGMRGRFDDWTREQYSAPHWDSRPANKDLLAHTRLDSRMVQLPSGGGRVKALFVNEFQSDIHEGARDTLRQAAEARVMSNSTGLGPTSPGYEQAVREAMQQLKKEGYEGYNKKEPFHTGEPDFPFKKTGEWVELVFKKALDEAVRRGHHWVVLPTGSQVHGATGAARVIRKLNVEMNSDGLVRAKGETHGGEDAWIADGDYVDQRTLAKWVGKDYADRVFNELEPGWVRDFDVNADIGSRGMEGFYNEIVPAVVKKYISVLGEKPDDIIKEVTVPGFGGKNLAIRISDKMLDNIRYGQRLGRVGGSAGAAQTGLEKLAAITKSGVPGMLALMTVPGAGAVIATMVIDDPEMSPTEKASIGAVLGLMGSVGAMRAISRGLPKGSSWGRGGAAFGGKRKGGLGDLVKPGSEGRPVAPRSAPGTEFTPVVDQGANPRALNIQKFDLGKDAETILRDKTEELIASGKYTKRRVSWGETKQTAGRLGLDLEGLVGRDRTFTEAELHALQNGIADTSDRMADVSKRILNPTTSTEVREELQAEYSRLEGRLQTYVRRFGREREQAGRSLNILKVLSQRNMDPAPWLVHAQKLKANVPLSQVELDTIRKLTREKDREGLIQFVSGLRKSSALEKGLTLWKAGLLTGPPTHIANAFGNTTMAALETAKEPVAALADMVISMVRSAQATGGFDDWRRFRSKDFDAKSLLVDQAKGFSRGTRAAMDVFKKGVSPEDLAKWDVRKTNFDSPILQAYTDVVFGALSASDQLFRGAAMGRALAEHSRIALQRQGLKRGSAQFAKELDNMLKAPPDDVIRRAIEDAEFATFMNDNFASKFFSGGKRAAQQGAPNRGPFATALVDLTVPFIKTPTNVAARTLDYTPVGLVTTLAKQLSKPDQRALAEGIARSAVGSSLIWLGVQLAAEGKATGASPSSPQERELWELQGKTANSVRVGDKWLNVGRLSPAGLLVALGAQMHRIAENADGASETLAGSVGAVGRLMTDQTFLRGISSLVEAMHAPEGRGQAFVKNLAGSAVPAAVARVTRGLQENETDSDSPEGAVVRRATGKGDTRVDAFGEPVKVPGKGPIERLLRSTFDPFNTSEVRDSKLLSEMERLGVTPAAGPTNVEDPTKKKGIRSLMKSERRKVLADMGPEMKQALEAIVSTPEYNAVNDQLRRRLLEGVKGRLAAEATDRVEGGEVRTPASDVIVDVLESVAASWENARERESVQRIVEQIRAGQQPVGTPQELSRAVQQIRDSLVQGAVGPVVQQAVEAAANTADPEAALTALAALGGAVGAAARRKLSVIKMTKAGGGR